MMNKETILIFAIWCVVLGTYAQDYTYRGGRDTNTGLTLVGKNGKFGYVDDGGREIIPVVYDEISDFGDGNRLACAKKNEKYGYVDTHGRLLSGFVYDDAFSFGWDDRLALVCKYNSGGNELFGYVNLKGELAIPCRYEFAMPFSNGYAAVSSDFKYGFIDEQGKQVIACQYDDVKWGFFEGYAWVKKNGKWGMIDKNGVSLSSAPFIYDNLMDFDFYEGFADVKKSYTTYYFDKQGVSYSSAEERRRANEKLKFQLATIEWKNSEVETNQPQYMVKAGVKSQSKITSITVAVEGQRGIHTVENDGYDAIVNRNVILNEGPNKIVISVANAAGTARIEKVVTYKKAKLPEVEWSLATETVKSSIYQIVANIKSESKLEDISILVNDVKNTTRGLKVVVADDYAMKLERVVKLSEGANTIKIFARNAAGPITTQAKMVVYEKEQLTKPVIERRLALVMGNANYASKDHVLKNPVNDAVDLANKLESLGFDVIRAFDQTKREMRNSISAFGKKANDYQVALFFYAGHGIRSKDNINYLIPIDAMIETQADVEEDCVSADLVVNTLADAQSPMKIVIFDACRNNPLERAWNRSLGQRGLVGMEPAAGMLIAYSTAAGSVAQDGAESRNSPYMSAVLKTLDVPGISLNDFFPRVCKIVMDQTGNQQTPWTSGAFWGEFYFNRK